MGFDIYVRWQGFEGFDSDPVAYNRQNAVSHNPPMGLLSYNVDMPSFIRNRAQQLNVVNPLAFLLDNHDEITIEQGPDDKAAQEPDTFRVNRATVERVRAERDALLDTLAELNRQLAFDSRFIMEALMDVVAFLNYVLLLVLEGKQGVTIHISY